MTPKESSIPPGGFHFIVKHDGAEVKIEASSYEALELAVSKYRLINGLPLGHPKDEIAHYVCSQWPHFCHGDTGMLLPRQPSSEEPLSRRVIFWMTSLWRLGAGNAVKPGEVERRTAVCAACPNAVDFHTGACGGCIDGVERLAFAWLAGRKKIEALDRKACKIIGSHLTAAVNADKQPLPTHDNAQLPDGCWLKKNMV
jgi:hypothetical protein